MPDLGGRVALVTGAARNIGASIAQQLGIEGAAVAVNHLPGDGAADEVVERIRQRGGAAAAFACDVADEDQVAEMVAAVASTLGRPDILVNNAAAAVTDREPWHELTAEGWDRVLRVNVTGAFLCARAVRPHMISRGGGAIVNISSVVALLGLPRNLHYVSSKAALIGFTRALAREAGAERIRVNAVLPGAIKTADEILLGDPDELEASLFAVQALRRRGVAEDIAAAVAFLASDEASFITGQCLTVDGGWAMQ